MSDDTIRCRCADCGHCAALVEENERLKADVVGLEEKTRRALGREAETAVKLHAAEATNALLVEALRKARPILRDHLASNPTNYFFRLPCSDALDAVDEALAKARP